MTTYDPNQPSELPDFDRQPDFELEPLRDMTSPAPKVTPPSASIRETVRVEAFDEDDEDDQDEDDDNQDDDSPLAENEAGTVRYRGATNDPAFGFLLALALAVGLTPLIDAGQSELRYTVAWGALALFGVVAWLFGNTERVAQEKPENVVWGISFALILGVPLVAFGGETLSTAVRLLFGSMDTGTLLAYLIFVIPLSETLFFRGVMQKNRQFWMIGLIGALWSIVLFAPLLNIFQYAAVAIVIFGVLFMMNMMYSYVCRRNGLAAAWVCQIMVNLVVVFLPYVGQ